MSAKESHSCLCGCGRSPKGVESDYILGHDLAHVQRLVGEALAGGNTDALRLELRTEELRERFDVLLEVRR